MRAFAKDTLMQGVALLLSMLLAFEPVAIAQSEMPSMPPPPADAPMPAQPAFSQQELDQMLAPIALYPDPLLSQILMASTYPLEVVEAARWSQANPYLKGDDAVRAVQQRDWDPSVKSLVAFPQILQMMDEKLDWTERLGDAFLAQEAQIMDTVQTLRQKAYAAGNLSSNDRIRVDTEGQTIAVEPANPDIVYVPYYDPTVVYGPWWWDDYPPVFWAPWPGYYVESGFAWGFGIIITTGFFFGDCDWHHHRVNVVNVNNYYIVHNDRHPTRDVYRAPGVWHHDPDHRRGVPYRDVSIRQRYGRVPASPADRQDFRGYVPPPFNRENRGIERGGAPIVSPARPDVTRERSGGVAASPRSDVGTGQSNRSFERGPQVRPGAPGEIGRPAREIRPPALEDIGRGTNVRDYSSRGRASHEGAVRSQGGAPVQRPSGNAAGGGGRMHPSR